MSAVFTLAASVAAAAGAVAVYRMARRQKEAFRSVVDAFRDGRAAGGSDTVIDCERDPATGVYKPKL